MNTTRLIIFVKNPIAGKVKTRLAKVVGIEKAKNIYIELLEKTNAITRQLSSDKAVYYADYINKEDLWDHGIYQKCLQDGVDLGERMANAFSESFAMGYTRAIIIGSDCYQLDKETIEQGFRVLKEHDVVLGPTYDGGYYMIGMKENQAALFKDKAWSTDKVYSQTVASCEAEKLSYNILKMLSDVDEYEDLRTMSD